MREAAVAEHLNGLRFGRTHRRVWLLAAMGIMLDGFDFFIMGVAIPLITADWGITPLQTGMLASSAIVGAIVGAAVMGPLSDRIGRRLAFRIDLAMFVVFALASALAPDIGWLIAFRFLLGVGIGADYPISASYVAEISPQRLRTRLLIGAFSFQAVGQLLGALVGLAILLVQPDPGAWRWMLAFGVIPAVIIVILRRNVPESPLWLAARARTDEAVAALSRFTGRQVTAAEVDADAAGAAPPAPPERVGLGRLLRGDSAGSTILTSAPWFFMDIATYGIGVFTPTVLAALALSSAANTPFIADDITATEGAAVLDLFLVAGFALALLLVRRRGLVVLQTTGFVVMAAALTALAATQGLTAGSALQTVLVFAAFAAFNLFMNAGPNATTYSMPADAFPTMLRGAGAGVAAAAGKTGAALGTFLFPLLQHSLGLAPTLLLIAGGCAAAAVITVALRRHATAGSTAAG